MTLNSDMLSFVLMSIVEVFFAEYFEPKIPLRLTWNAKSKVYINNQSKIIIVYSPSLRVPWGNKPWHSCYGMLSVVLIVVRVRVLSKKYYDENATFVIYCNHSVYLKENGNKKQNICDKMIVRNM